jgi:hypothetical protein
MMLWVARRILYTLYLGVVVIVLDDITVNVLLEHVDFGRSELACADTLLEEHVHLGKRAPGRLRHAEIGVDHAKETQTSL